MANSMLQDVMDEDAKLDMTPMIDVVFLLIIFFMIVTKINEDKLELLKLPSATQASPDPGKGSRLIVNVNEEGTVKINGVEFKFSELESKFEQEVKYLDGGLEQAKAQGGSKLVVLLRADQKTQYYHVQEIIRMLSKKAIFKLDIAVANN